MTASTPTKYVALYRVSTGKQGRSGLGLGAQRELVAYALRLLGGVLVSEHQAVESGRKDIRPVVDAALADARSKGATLIIATLDRLARKVHFISGLMESGVPFCCADCPNASPFELHIRAAMAEEEGRKISERTKAGLQQVKQRLLTEGAYVTRGGRTIDRLGSPKRSIEFYRQIGRKGHRKRREKAQRQSQDCAASLRAAELREEGLTQREIADRLNAEGFVTPRGKAFGGPQVHRLLVGG